MCLCGFVMDLGILTRSIDNLLHQQYYYYNCSQHTKYKIYLYKMFYIRCVPSQFNHHTNIVTILNSLKYLISAMLFYSNTFKHTNTNTFLLGKDTIIFDEWKMINVRSLLEDINYFCIKYCWRGSLSVT